MLLHTFFERAVRDAGGPTGPCALLLAATRPVSSTVDELAVSRWPSPSTVEQAVAPLTSQGILCKFFSGSADRYALAHRVWSPTLKTSRPAM